MKKSDVVFAVILNDKGEVLAVSRKTDHKDFGLVGGKVDPEDLTLVSALAREIKEETGLKLLSADLLMMMPRKDKMGYSYLVTVEDFNIHTYEPHIVKWTNFKTIIDGGNGEFNKLVAQCLEIKGVKFKM